MRARGPPPNVRAARLITAIPARGRVRCTIAVRATGARLVVLASGGLLIPSPPPHPRGQSRGVQLTVEASGDLLIHSPIFDRALALGGGRHYDFAPFFVRIRPYIRGAGLALCHVETPMTPAPPAGYPIFNTPPELAPAIRQTGWRACSTAATHTLDQGQAGVDDTIRALDRAGVAHTGSFSSRGRPEQRR